MCMDRNTYGLLNFSVIDSQMMTNTPSPLSLIWFFIPSPKLIFFVIVENKAVLMAIFLSDS